MECLHSFQMKPCHALLTDFESTIERLGISESRFSTEWVFGQCANFPFLGTTYCVELYKWVVS